ncbi:type II secretion system F family protein [Candidatus Synechococcus spongiarum]|uniref:type II secretion system F family protein n=1 Tax=Candidatus Synechococcus spongiarum TaxID=431041 RepID=UPI00046EFE2D|nr:type II secretion system F family protein [Candidatus Synechococcus spongiarum]
MRYTATCRDKQGAATTVELTAASLVKARRILQRRQLTPLRIQPLPERPPSAGWRFTVQRPPSRRERAVWASKLSALVGAGVPIVRGLDLVAEQQRSPLFKRSLAAVSLDVRQGDSLGAAMKRWPRIFDPMTVAMVMAGEAAGVMDEVLAHLAVVLESNAKLENQLRQAVTYPLMILIMAVGAFLGMTLFLIPTFAGVFAELGAELPLFTQAMVNLSHWLRSPWAVAALLVALLALAGLSMARNTPRGRRQWDEWTLAMAVFGPLLRKTATAQFCRTLACLTRAGVPILAAMEIARAVIRNGVMDRAVAQARHRLEEGELLSTALGSGNVFPHTAITMVAIGEETGRMHVMLAKIADFYEAEVTTTLKTLTAMVEPMMILVVGGIVGSILMAMYLPMLTVFDQIQ